MEEPLVKIHYWLYPISWIYGLGVRLRNKLFDWGYYRSKSFDVPVVCVGNLAVGGTGKTPHTEYLIKLLQQTGTNVAMLSRGYKRKSKGYVLATEETDVKRIGDEPYQIKTKFPAIRVAVDENRCHGIFGSRLFRMLYEWREDWKRCIRSFAYLVRCFCILSDL